MKQIELFNSFETASKSLKFNNLIFSFFIFFISLEIRNIFEVYFNAISDITEPENPFPKIIIFLFEFLI